MATYNAHIQEKMSLGILDHDKLCPQPVADSFTVKDSPRCAHAEHLMILHFNRSMVMHIAVAI